MPLRESSVCIVGAGASGLTLAHALASSGWRVTLVEGGDVQPPDEVEDTYEALVVGTPHRGIREGRFRAWGGSTTRWGGQLWQWDRSEFEPRSYLGLHGWPIDYEDVYPYYASAFALLGVAEWGLTEDGAVARGVLRAPLNSADFAIKYSTWLPWRLRNLGRSIGSRLRRMPNVTVHLRTTALGIVMAPSGTQAIGVRVRWPDGTVRLLNADVIVIAAGAIETSRLLLVSGQSETALGNRSGWLGRGFMDHLSVRVARFRPRDDRMFARMFAPVVVRGVQSTPRILLRPAVLERERLLGAYGHWDITVPKDSGVGVLRDKLRAAQAGAPLRPSVSDLRALGSSLRDLMALARGILVDGRRYYPANSAIYLRVDTEQLPDVKSRITLTADEDSLGLPRVAVDWRVSEVERRTVRRAAELLGEELERSGVGTLEPALDPFDSRVPWGELKGDSFHMMGGTRMARVAEEGVVDPNCRVVDTHNLYIAGASVFPTGGVANPTLTLIALTLRLADHLIRVS